MCMYDSIIYISINNTECFFSFCYSLSSISPHNGCNVENPELIFDITDFFTFILIIVYLHKHTHTHNEHSWRQHGGFYICCFCFIFLLSDNFDLVNCNFSVLHQPLNICCCYCCCWYKHIQIYKVMNDDRRQTVC